MHRQHGEDRYGYAGCGCLLVWSCSLEQRRRTEPMPIRSHANWRLVPHATQLPIHVVCRCRDAQKSCEDWLHLNFTEFSPFTTACAANPGSAKQEVDQAVGSREEPGQLISMRTRSTLITAWNLLGRGMTSIRFRIYIVWIDGWWFYQIDAGVQKRVSRRLSRKRTLHGNSSQQWIVQANHDRFIIY